MIDIKLYYSKKVLEYFKSKEKYRAVQKQLKTYVLHNKNKEVIRFASEAILK